MGTDGLNKTSAELREAEGENELRNASNDFKVVWSGEFPGDTRLWISAAESGSIRLALLGIAATFFTWGLAYVFEYIDERKVIDAVAIATFFAGALFALVLARIQYIFYRRLARFRRREIDRATQDKNRTNIDEDKNVS